MKPWILAAVLGLALAIGAAVGLPLIVPGGDKDAIFGIAANVSFRALVPALVIGACLGRVRANRVISLLVTWTAAIGMLVWFARSASGEWLWQLGSLAVVSCVLCGIPLLYIFVAIGRTPNKAPLSTPASGTSTAGASDMLPPGAAGR